jgi:DNA-binding CsgD family transcriptional regulator
MTRIRRRDVRAFRLRYGGEELAVLSIPLCHEALPGSLTPAEREVCALLLGGLSNQEIAARRGCAVRTVANQVAAIFRKAGVSSRSELAARIAEGRGPDSAD